MGGRIYDQEDVLQRNAYSDYIGSTLIQIINRNQVHPFLLMRVIKLQWRSLFKIQNYSGEAYVKFRTTVAKLM